MKMTFAVLADHVADAQGKLYISGTFDVLNVQQFPAALPLAGLAVKLEATHGEAGDHTVAVELRDEDGQLAGPQLTTQLQLVANTSVRGASTSFQMAVNYVGGLQFTKAGMTGVHGRR